MPRPWLLFAALLMVVARPALATTARDLSSRIQIDGFTRDFESDEVLFGVNDALHAAEEPNDDSKWGPNNDLNQIRITWDAQYLYLAGEGKIWGNNMVLLIDVLPGRGLATMSQLNSWSRNFYFTEDFAPDLFGATWDGNTSPHLILHRGGTQVDDQQVGALFRAAATFSQDQPGRAMELAIPWNTVLLGPEGVGTHDTVLTVAGARDTFRLFPPGTKLRIAGVITAGGDNTGGPDSGPDNTRGHSDNGNADVIIDNDAIVDLDRNDDTGLGHGGPDGVADWNVSPKARTTFKYEPPIKAVRFGLADLRVDRPAFAPDRGERAAFHVRLDPPLDTTDPLSAIRTVDVTANLFDLHGRFVRNLYIADHRPALTPGNPGLDAWDGRDEKGAIVPPGVYVLRVVLEPNQSRITRAVVVVR